MDSSPSSKPLEWIHLELLPLPDKVGQVQECVVWWNPQTGEVLGDEADYICGIIDAQFKKGSVANTTGTIEISDPYKKPTELASILGQFYWVVPVPVAYAYESVTSSSENAAEDKPQSLQ